jgi:hypothetical protein
MQNNLAKICTVIKSSSHCQSNPCYDLTGGWPRRIFMRRPLGLNVRFHRDKSDVFAVKTLQSWDICEHAWLCAREAGRGYSAFGLSPI